MRTNIYHEEISGEISVVGKTADTGESFVGLRIFLHSPSQLHNRDDDDDRSAVTFWFPAPDF